MCVDTSLLDEGKHKPLRLTFADNVLAAPFQTEETRPGIIASSFFISWTTCDFDDGAESRDIRGS